MPLNILSKIICIPHLLRSYVVKHSIFPLLFIDNQIDVAIGAPPGKKRHSVYRKNENIIHLGTKKHSEMHL